LKREVSEPQVLKWRGVRDLNPRGPNGPQA
jgi:hypothetical protein